MRAKVLACASVLAVSANFTLAACVHAAEIRAVSGQLLINEGSGYRAIEGPTRLKVGDAVIAAPQGLGSLSYDDGCIIDVVPGAISWIRPGSPCGSVEGSSASQRAAPILHPRVKFDPNWLRSGAALIDGRKPAAGP